MKDIEVINQAASNGLISDEDAIALHTTGITYCLKLNKLAKQLKDIVEVQEKEDDKYQEERLTVLNAINPELALRVFSTDKTG